MGVRGKLIALVLLALTPLVLLDLVQIYTRYERNRGMELEWNRELAQTIAGTFIHYLDSLWTTELALGRALMDSGEPLEAKAGGQLMSEQLALHPAVSRFSWVTPEGRVVVSTDPRLQGMIISDRPYLQRIVRGEVATISELMQSQATGESVVVVARGIRREGRLLGIVTATLDVQRLGSVMPLERVGARSFGLVDPQGMVVYRNTDPNLPWERRRADGQGPALSALAGEVTLTGQFRSGIDDRIYMGAGVPVSPIGWAVFAIVPVDEVMAAARTDTVRDLTVVLLALVGSCAGAFLVGRRLSGPILKLQEAALAISRGDLTVRVEPQGHDEVAAAARTFNQMAARIQESEAKLLSQAMQQGAVAVLGQQALQETDLLTLLDEAVHLAAETLQVPYAFMLELLPEEGTLVLRAGAGVPDGMVGASFTETHFGVPEVHRKLGVISGMSVPIHGPVQALGTLWVYSTIQRTFTRDDEHFLQAVANVLAAAIQRTRDEEERAALLALEQESRARAEDAQLRITFLDEASELLSASLDFDITLTRVAQLAVSYLADWCVVDLLEQDGGIRRVTVAHRDPAVQALAEELKLRPPDPHGGTQAALAIRTGRPILLPEVPEPHITENVGDEEHLSIRRRLSIQSAMLVPLVVQGRTLGVIHFISDDPVHRFNQDDLALAEGLANRSAVAVENARLYRELEEALQEQVKAHRHLETMALEAKIRARQQAAVAKLGQMALEGATVLRVLHEATAVVAALLRADLCTAVELRPCGKTLLLRAGWGVSVRRIGTTSVSLESDEQALYTLAADGPVVVEDLQEESRFAPSATLMEAGVRGTLSATLRSRERPLGILSVHTRERRAFSGDDVHFLQAVANLLATTLDRTQAQQRLAVQYSATRVLAESHTLANAGPQLLQILCEGLGWDIGVLWLRDRSTDQICCTHLWHIPELDGNRYVSSARKRASSRDSGFPSQVWSDGLPLWLADVNASSEFARRPDSRQAGLRGGVWVPICVGGETLGVMEFLSQEVREQDRGILRTLSAISSQVGQFIQRQRAEADLRTLNAELERRVTERTAELAAANRELEAFSYSVSHDLRAPLRTIDGFSQALLEDCREALDADGQDYLGRIRGAARRMGQLIDDLLRLSRVMRSDMTREMVDLSELSRTVAADLQRADPNRTGVMFRIEEGLTAYGDERLLRVAVENLLGNAWKFTAREPETLIEFGKTREGAFFVRDHGVGFDMAYADKLFRAFQRLHAAAEFEGTGIGLATVQRIIHRHGGRVWAEGAVDRGATVYFTL